jgi:diguanylate cyclase (GGDEF)-like protein
MGEAPHDSQSVVPGRRGSDALIARAARGYVDAICGGDAEAAAAVIDDALDRGVSPVELQSRVIAPAMRAVGVLWEGGGMSVAEEHLATAISYQTLTRLYPVLLGQGKRRGDAVVVAGAAGDHHLLALRMVADVFEGAGFAVLFAGADVPQEVLLALVAEHQPAIVALGITMPLNAAALARELLALRAHDPQLRLVVGGQGVPETLRECGGVFYAADTEQLADYAERVMAEPLRGELPRDIGDGGVVAAGNFDDREPDVGGGLEARFAKAAAVFADAARGNARRVFALEQIAFRDPLTDLWNRRAFEDRWQALTEDGPDVQPPGLVMIDVDHFKAINDGYGHRAGDLALIGVARCITDSLRPGDFAARFGGDEFVVLLPNTPATAAGEIGERIRRRIATTLTAPQITVSIGISAPGHTDLRRAALDADRALYAAKEHGRNQLVVA